MTESAKSLLTWLRLPQSWAEAAYLVTREAVSDSEASSVSHDTLQRHLVEIVSANQEMEAARKQLQDSLPPEVHMLLEGAYVRTMQLSGRYVDAIRSLVDAIKSDCELSSASVETYGAVLKRFDLEESKLARSSEAARDELAQPATAKKLAFKQMGDPEDMCQHCETPFGTYVLDGFPKGWMVTFQLGTTGRRIHDRAGLTFERAVQMAQNDFNQRVAECLALPDAGHVAAPETKVSTTPSPRRARPS